MSNATVLDAGTPPPLVSVELDAEGIPVTTIAEPGSPEAIAALQHANALAAVVGTEEEPTGYGTYLRRVGAVQAGIAVVANVCTVGPGAVLGVQATAGGSTGRKGRVFFGSPDAGEVRIDPQANGTQRLTFHAADAVTVCSVYLLASSAAMIAVLDAAASPEE
jgi:hypothetical protein